VTCIKFHCKTSFEFRRCESRNTVQRLLLLTIMCGAVGVMLEAYHKPSTIVKLRTTLQKIWNELPQKPVAKAVQNFHKRSQACVNKARGHLLHFI